MVSRMVRYDLNLSYSIFTIYVVIFLLRIQWYWLQVFWLQICVIANVCPDTVDEVFALVPSLKVPIELFIKLKSKYLFAFYLLDWLSMIDLLFPTVFLFQAKKSILSDPLNDVLIDLAMVKKST